MHRPAIFSSTISMARPTKSSASTTIEPKCGQIADRLRAEGRRPYITLWLRQPSGRHRISERGAELSEQAAAQGLTIRISSTPPVPAAPGRLITGFMLLAKPLR